MYLLLCIQCWTSDDGKKTCPKHVEFYSKNKFEKLVHFVGFIIIMSEICTEFIVLQFILHLLVDVIETILILFSKANYKVH